MRVGLVGYGAWGRHHADAIAATPGFTLAGICTRSESSRTAARERFPGVRAWSDYHDLLSSPGLEAVDIVVPTPLHHEIATEALFAGKHVLLEKPMALTREQCRSLVNVAEGAGRVLYVAHEFRLSAQWGRMKQLAREFGRPLAVAIDLWRRPYRLGSDGWRHDPARVGSWILEEPIHFFDLACWWVGEAPRSVYARGSRLSSTPLGLWDNLAAVLEFPSGAHATVTQCLSACEHHLAARVAGENGAVIATWDGEIDRTTEPRAALKLVRGGQIQDVPLTAPSGEFFELRAEVARFLAACRGEAPPPISPAEAARAVAVCQAAEESIRTGLPVAL